MSSSRGSSSSDPGTRAAPSIADTAWVAPTADVVGDVRIGPHASVWYGCVLRGDIAPIRIGPESNIQDLTVVHVDHGLPAVIGARVGVGHRAIIHGCEIEDDCLIGMGAVILSGAVIGQGSVIGAGALVTEGVHIPPRSLVLGMPGRVVRTVDEELSVRTRRTIENYRALKDAHRTGRWRPE